MIGVLPPPVRRVAILPHAVLMRIHAGDDGSTARSAEPLRRVVGIETDAVFRERVDIGGMNGFHPVGPEGVAAALVEQEEENVRMPLPWLSGLCGHPAGRERPACHASEK